MIENVRTCSQAISKMKTLFAAFITKIASVAKFIKNTLRIDELGIRNILINYKFVTAILLNSISKVTLV